MIGLYRRKQIGYRATGCVIDSVMSPLRPGVNWEWYAWLPLRWSGWDRSVYRGRYNPSRVWWFFIVYLYAHWFTVGFRISPARYPKHQRAAWLYRGNLCSVGFRWWRWRLSWNLIWRSTPPIFDGIDVSQI